MDATASPAHPVTYFRGDELLTFRDDDAAYEFAADKGCCLTDADGREVYCRRWDH